MFDVSAHAPFVLDAQEVHRSAIYVCQGTAISYHIVFPCVFCVCVMISTIKDGSTPLLAAAFHGHLDMVKFLVLEANADPHQPDTV